MKTNDFNFFLPQDLIAQTPPLERGQSRLMTLNRSSGGRSHKKVNDLADILCCENFLSPQGDKPLLVFNDTKVRKARLIGKAFETGINSVFLLIEKTDGEDGKCWKVITKHTSRKKKGYKFIFYSNENDAVTSAEVTGHDGIFLILMFERIIDDDFLERYGHVPLPPYIKRDDAAQDAERYQTIYAKEQGSAAAPTAGLHFTKDLLDTLDKNGIKKAFVTLHVGLGTFLPVHSENIEDHIMHEEQFHITDDNARIIENAVIEKRKIIAVGTTSLRALESAFTLNEKGEASLKRGVQSTSIFIYPGYKFKITDGLFTNFHTPHSTLLMLVSAFAGKDLILESYEDAVRSGYRFFSYGDAMLIY